MNPAGQRSEQPPQGSRTVQYTTVSVTSEPPRDYIVWSLMNVLYCNPFCLGLVAFISSVRARDRKVAGDVEGALRHGADARRYNIIATVLGSIMTLIFIIVILINLITLINQINQINELRQRH